MGELAIKADMFPHRPIYDLLPCAVDIQAIVSRHVECVVKIEKVSK